MKKKEVKEEDKFDKILKTVGFICLVIVLIEFISLGGIYLNREAKNVYYDVSNDIENYNDYFVTAGSSDFRYSKINKKTSYQKATITVYKNNRVVKEFFYDSKYNSSFSSVVKVNDGYLAVGSVEKNKYDNSNRLSRGLLVKFDLDGKYVWSKSYKILANSMFTKVMIDGDNYIVVGQSIYENLEIGNSTRGGGIIVKFDKNGKEIWHGNYGGNKSGIFYDVLKYDDSYYAVGKDSVDTGVIVKYDLDGKLILEKNYSNTDMIGFSALASKDNYLYVVGAKKQVTVKNQSENYDALLIKYDTDLNIVWDKTYNNSAIGHWGDVILDGDNIIVSGYMGEFDLKNSTKSVNKYKYLAMIGKYNLDGNLSWVKKYNKPNNEYYSALTMDKDNIVVLGYSNSKLNIKSNGKDYVTLLNRYDSSGKLLDTFGKVYK